MPKPGMILMNSAALVPSWMKFSSSLTVRRLEFSPEGLTFTVGYDETDWAEAGMYPYFYPVILGSSTQSANDFLFRVHEAHRERVTRAVGDAIRRGVEGVRA